MRCVVFVAIGTRGDVQPLAVLATALSASSAAPVTVTFVTHEAHRGLLTGPFQRANVKLRTLSSLPAASWTAADSISRCSVRTDAEKEAVDREECLQAIIASVLGGSCDETSTPDGGAGAVLVAFNLFALEAWHIAEALGAAAVCLNAYLIPYPPPSSFERGLERLAPGLVDRLRDADGGSISWADVDHWMWPLFSVARWGAWREKRLGLSPLPLTSSSATGHSGAPPCPLPAATPLLYGFGESVAPRPGFWPEGIRLMGYWPADADWERHSAAEPQRSSGAAASEGSSSGAAASEGSSSGAHRCGSTEALPPSVEAFLGGCGGRAPVCFTLGSLAAIGAPAVPNPRALLENIQAALALVDRPGVILMEAGTPLAAAWADLSRSGAGEGAGSTAPQQASVWGDLLGFAGSLPHALLFPRCAAVVHHGGSGTTAAAALAGTPQVVAPHMLDQFFWAERMAYLGVSPEPLAAAVLHGGADAGSAASATVQLASAIRIALGDDARRCAADLAQRAAAEVNVSATTAVLLDALERGSTQGSPGFGPAVRARAEALLRPGGAWAAELDRRRASGPSASPSAGGSAPTTGPGAAAAADWRAPKRARAVSPPPRSPDGCGEVVFSSSEGDAGHGAAGGPSFIMMSAPGLNFGPAAVLSREEAVYLHREIFAADLYFRCGVRLPGRAGAFVVDVGANVGLFSLCCATELLRLRREAGQDVITSADGKGRPWQQGSLERLRILAVEPGPAAFAALERNLRPLTADGAEVLTVRAALVEPSEPEGCDSSCAPQPREALLTVYPRMPGNSTLHPAEKRALQSSSVADSFWEGAHESPVALRTLSEVLCEKGLADCSIDLLKVDVEGAELRVLEGISAETWPRVQQVVIETHPVNGRPERLRKMLEGHGFTVTVDARAVGDLARGPETDVMVYAVRASGPTG